MTSTLYDVPGPRARRRTAIVSIVVIALLAAGIAWLIFAMAAPRVTAAGAVQPGLFDSSRWDIFLDAAIWRRIAGALAGTLGMAAVGAVLALVIGFLFSFARSARNPVIRLPSTTALEFFRGMPVLLMMLFILLVFGVPPFWAGVWALALYNGAVIGEVLRAGIAALPRGQQEAGLVIGLTPFRVRVLIELPQAVRNMLPAIVAQLIVLVKDTALAYVISYDELLKTVVTGISNFVGNQYFFSLFLVVVALYLAVNFLLSLLARALARRATFS